MPTFLDDLFSVALYLVGARISKGKGINFSSAFTAAVNPNSGNVDVGLSGSGAAAALSGSSLSLASLTVTGNVTQDTILRIPFHVTTTGSGSAALPGVPMAANKLFPFTIEVGANCSAGGGALVSLPPGAGYGTGGSPAFVGVLGDTLSALGLNPANLITWSYAAATLTGTVHGPGVTVTGAANNGSGKVRLTIGGGTTVDDTMNGASLNIAGIVGTTEANGTHVGTFVDSVHVDLLTVNFVNAYVSGGTVVYAGNPTTSWSGWLQVITTP